MDDKPFLPKCILMSADPIGGVWTYALELSSALRARGVRVALATMGAALTRAQRAEALAAGNIELFESTYKLEWMDAPWADVDRAGEWLLELEECVRPDVIHLNGYSHAALPWQGPVVVVAHSCVLSWWRAVKGEPAPRRWDGYRERVKAGLESADLIIAPSRAMATEIEALYGPLAIEVIANGRDAARFSMATKEPLILSAGRLWDEAKNISSLALVAPQVSWPIYVAGDFSPSPTLSSDQQNLRLLGHLSFDQLSQWFARASIYALPAHYEPFGLSVLEAALNGCALVLGDIPSLRENWSEAAAFIEPNDPGRLTACLAKWIKDPQRRSEWAARAQVRAKQFTVSTMTERYCGAYTNLIASRSQPNQKEEGACAF